MKQLPITSPPYRYVLKAFKEWLDVLGYAESTVYGLPNNVQEFLHYLEQNGKHQITDIENKIMKEYYRQLKQRSNTRRGGGLSPSYLNKHVQALQKFSNYLRQSGRLVIPRLHIQQEEANHEIKHVLTQEEVQQLYAACDQYETEMQNKKMPMLYESLALRDKAMLTILYGCGLRRNEAVHLDINDIQTDKQYVYVKKGKNYKERLVPINAKNLQCLQDYIYEGRPHFLKNEKVEAFFITNQSKRILGDTLLQRLKLLIQRVENIELQQKEIGLHTLRHSIATHLLQNGMPLESIAKFLGHSSLESTQIYTHLIEKEDENSLYRTL
jgi:integrase/recombinase XerD